MADAYRAVGEPDRQRIAVGIAVGNDGGDVEIPARPQNAERNLATIGNQDFSELTCAHTKVSGFKFQVSGSLF